MKILFAALLVLLPLAAFADEVLNTRTLQTNIAETNFAKTGVQAFASFSVIPLVRATGWYEDTLAGTLGVFRQKLSAMLTPITVSASYENVWTLPLPVFEVGASVLVGTGWYLEGWGNGIGMQSNFYDPSITANVYAHENFNKEYIRFGGSLAIQADLAWVLPGPWSHLVFRSKQEVYYRYFLGSLNDTNTWMWENTPDNMKHLRWYGSWYVGYHMPLFLSRVGFIYDRDLDIRHLSDSTVASGGWGSDIFAQTTGFLFTFSFDREDRQTLDMSIIWGNEVNYKPGKGNEITLWGRQVLAPDNYDFWHLRRIAFAWNYNF